MGTERSEIDCRQAARKVERQRYQNGHIESFHDKLRDECLNRELFSSLREAQVVIERWKCEYNQSRRHS